MRKDLAKLIGKRVRRQREYLGLTQDAASELLGISTQFLSEIERGRKGISAGTLYKICANYNISADEVLMGKDKLPDTGKIVKMISMMEVKYLPAFEEIVKAFIRSTTIK